MRESERERERKRGDRERDGERETIYNLCYVDRIGRSDGLCWMVIISVIIESKMIPKPSEHWISTNARAVNWTRKAENRTASSNSSFQLVLIILCRVYGRDKITLNSSLV